MLGPVRFQHIENCARAALSQYMVEEALLPLKKELIRLDGEMAVLRSELSGSDVAVAKVEYHELDLEKVERLLLARKRAIEMLKKRINTRAAPPSQPLPSTAVASSIEKEATEEAEAKVENILEPSKVTEEEVGGRRATEEKRLEEASKAPDTTEIQLSLDNEGIIDDDNDDDLTGWDALQ
jgi:hypothetical protein